VTNFKKDISQLLVTHCSH